MTTATYTVLPITAVDPSPDQNRETFDPSALGELAQSIDARGLLAPITVRENGARWVLVAGERRLRACRDLLGWSEIPALVQAGEDDDPLENALRTLDENIHRDNPPPLEEARGFARILHFFDGDTGRLASRLGKPPRWVRDRLSLLALADDVAHYVQTGALPLWKAILMAELDVNRQRLALQAHQGEIGAHAFRALVARLLTEQGEESMFDPDSFLRLEEYVVEAENTARAEADKRIVREPPLGISEVAELLEVKPQTVNVWGTRGLLPEPDGRISGSPYWYESTIKTWARETGRL